MSGNRSLVQSGPRSSNDDSSNHPHSFPSSDAAGTAGEVESPEGLLLFPLVLAIAVMAMVKRLLMRSAGMERREKGTAEARAAKIKSVLLLLIVADEGVDAAAFDAPEVVFSLTYLVTCCRMSLESS